jgi:hypothetical protein
MSRLRTLHLFSRLLAALFLVAQLAGVVSSPRAHEPVKLDAASSHSAHHHHDHGDGGATHHHHGGGRDLLDGHCCALHAFFAGVLPLEITVAMSAAPGKRLAPDVAECRAGPVPSRIDRPPRPLSLS